MKIKYFTDIEKFITAIKRWEKEKNGMGKKTLSKKASKIVAKTKIKKNAGTDAAWGT